MFVSVHCDPLASKLPPFPGPLVCRFKLFFKFCLHLVRHGVERAARVHAARCWLGVIMTPPVNLVELFLPVGCPLSTGREKYVV